MQDCDTVEIIWMFPTILLNNTFLFFQVAFMYKFINTHSRLHGDSFIFKVSYYSAVVFSFSTFLCFIAYNLEMLVFCFARSFGYDIFYAMITVMYSSQFYFLLMVLFIRLVSVFHGTTFKMSIRIIIIYCGMYMFLGIMIIIAIIMHNAHYQIGYIFIGICIIVGVSLTIFISVLFMYKLTQVYGMKDDDTLILIITKNTLLEFISVVFTLISLGGVTLMSMKPSVHSSWVSLVAVILDTFTNYLCVMLTFECFGNHYKSLCHCIDYKCTILCKRIVKNQGKKLKEQLELQPVDSKSDPEM